MKCNNCDKEIDDDSKYCCFCGNKIIDLSDNNKIESLIDFVGIKVGDDVLDVGCGKGVITPILYQKSQKKVIAMDLSKNISSNGKIHVFFQVHMEHSPKETIQRAIQQCPMNLEQ